MNLTYKNILLRGIDMTYFEKIKNMNIDELAKYFANTFEFPYSACYICEYDYGPPRAPRRGGGGRCASSAPQARRGWSC